MNLLLLFSTIAIIVTITINFFGWFFLMTKKEELHPEPEKKPAVAILIAARNEEEYLPRCLEAIEKLSYPADLLSVWIGDDRSQDATREIAQDFCKGRERWHVLTIEDSGKNTRGKANVLAQLAEVAAPGADYFFITDADVVVSKNWIQDMLRFFKPGTAMVSGTTLVRGETWFAKMQRMDWLMAMAWIKAFSLVPLIGKVVTATGNNMAVDKGGYQAVGGYETIPFSITEDFELHQQMVQRAYKTCLVSSPGTKAFTLPVDGWAELMYQRKRWMTGAMQLPATILSILFIQSLFFPAILVLLLNYPIFCFVLLGVKWLVQALMVRKLLLRLEEPVTFPLVGYEFYQFILNVSQLVFYFLPVPIKWKGRRY